MLDKLLNFAVILLPLLVSVFGAIVSTIPPTRRTSRAIWIILILLCGVGGTGFNYWRETKRADEQTRERSLALEKQNELQRKIDSLLQQGTRDRPLHVQLVPGEQQAVRDVSRRTGQAESPCFEGLRFTSERMPSPAGYGRRIIINPHRTITTKEHVRFYVDTAISEIDTDPKGRISTFMSTGGITEVGLKEDLVSNKPVSFIIQNTFPVKVICVDVVKTH